MAINTLIGHDLRRAVAAARGWRNIDVSEWQGGFDDVPPIEDLGGIPPGELHVHRVPFYDTDPTDVLPLLDEMNADDRYEGINLMFDRPQLPQFPKGRWECSLDRSQGHIEGSVFVVGDTIAEAAARCYVEYKNASTGMTGDEE
jgi:hypothetical protein